MAKDLSKILVIDVEATCWPKDKPTDEQSEIIEIGLCVINTQSCQRIEKRALLVKPTKSQISLFCTKLTTITREMVAQAPTFPEVLQTLKKEYGAKSCLWASWGDYDRRQFERQCKAENLGYPFGPTHLNVKNLFALSHKLKREVGVAKAFEILGWEMEGTHHRGIDDAWNIGRVLGYLLQSMQVQALGSQ